MNPLPTGIFRSVRDYAGRVRAIRAQLRTERLLNELPASMRKDIGWPDQDEIRHGRNR